MAKSALKNFIVVDKSDFLNDGKPEFYKAMNAEQAAEKYLIDYPTTEGNGFRNDDLAALDIVVFEVSEIKEVTLVPPPPVPELTVMLSKPHKSRTIFT